MDIHIYGNPASVPATVAATSDTVLSTKASGNTCASVSVISSAVMSPKVTADPSYSSLLSSVLAPAGPPFSLCATPSRGLFSDPEPVFGGEFLQEARAHSVTVASSQAGISPPLLTPERQATPASEAAAAVPLRAPSRLLPALMSILRMSSLTLVNRKITNLLIVRSQRLMMNRILRQSLPVIRE